MTLPSRYSEILNKEFTAVIYEVPDKDDKMPSTWSGFILGNGKISALKCEDMDEAKFILKRLLEEEIPGATITNRIVKNAKGEIIVHCK